MILSYLVLAATLLAIFLLVLFVLQEKLIFVADALPDAFHFQFKTAYSERTLDLTVSGGDEKIHSLIFEPDKPHSLILYFHGNAGNLSSWGEVAEELAQNTNSVVWIMDFPGYGKSTGAISSQLQLLSLADMFGQKASAEAKARGLQFVIYGRSIGTGLASYLASAQGCDLLVLESPYYSMGRMARRTLPFLPEFLLNFILKYKLQQNLWLAQVKAPVLIFHGDRDATVPVQNSIDLKAEIPRLKLILLPGFEHGNIAQSPLYWSELKGTLNGKPPAL